MHSGVVLDKIKETGSRRSGCSRRQVRSQTADLRLGRGIVSTLTALAEQAQAGRQRAGGRCCAAAWRLLSHTLGAISRKVFCGRSRGNASARLFEHSRALRIKRHVGHRPNKDTTTTNVMHGHSSTQTSYGVLQVPGDKCDGARQAWTNKHGDSTGHIDTAWG